MLLNNKIVKKHEQLSSTHKQCDVTEQTDWRHITKKKIRI